MITKYFKYQDGSLIPKAFKDESEVFIPNGVEMLSKEEFDTILNKIPHSCANLKTSESQRIAAYRKYLKTQFYKRNELTDLQANFLAGQPLSKLDVLNLENEIETHFNK